MCRASLCIPCKPCSVLITGGCRIGCGNLERLSTRWLRTFRDKNSRLWHEPECKECSHGIFDVVYSVDCILKSMRGEPCIVVHQIVDLQPVSTVGVSVPKASVMQVSHEQNSS